MRRSAARAVTPGAAPPADPSRHDLLVPESDADLTALQDHDVTGGGTGPDERAATASRRRTAPRP